MYNYNRDRFESNISNFSWIHNFVSISCWNIIVWQLLSASDTWFLEFIHRFKTYLQYLLCIFFLSKICLATFDIYLRIIALCINWYHMLALKYSIISHYKVSSFYKKYKQLILNNWKPILVSYCNIIFQKWFFIDPLNVEPP